MPVEENPPPAQRHEWRNWTDGHGSHIEAYLKAVHPRRATVVRRDGREFAAPLQRFSPEDRLYIQEWAQNYRTTAEALREIDFADVELPARYEIPNVERRKPGPGEPIEPAAIQMVLDYYGIRYDPTLADRISVREIDRDRFIPPRDLVNALKGTPVEAETIASWDPYAQDHEETWQFALNMIRAALSMDLPVIVGYRPYMEVDTLELVGVAVGYDQRNLHIIEPTGSRQPARFHVRDLEFMFAYAMILFPTFEPSLPAVEEMRLEAEFLNRISDAIREAREPDAHRLAELLQDRDLDATVQDVNRSDFRDRLGKTRTFARRGGLPLIDSALNNARVVVVPQEYDQAKGFALIYGRVEEFFATVEFFPDGTFERGFISRPDLARRWLTRVERTYRLDLIQVVVPDVPDVARPPPPPELEDPPPPIEPPVEDPPPPPSPPSPPDPPTPPEPPDPPGALPS
jgi:hypothetical protein